MPHVGIDEKRLLQALQRACSLLSVAQQGVSHLIGTGRLSDPDFSPFLGVLQGNHKIWNLSGIPAITVRLYSNIAGDGDGGKRMFGLCQFNNPGENLGQPWKLV